MCSIISVTLFARKSTARHSKEYLAGTGERRCKLRAHPLAGNAAALPGR